MHAVDCLQMVSTAASNEDCPEGSSEYMWLMLSVSPPALYLQAMVALSCRTGSFALNIAGNALQTSAQRVCIGSPSSGTCAMLVEVRLAYSHMVVLDSFFDETEREALLSQLTESGWAHAQVGLALGSGLPKAYSQRML